MRPVRQHLPGASLLRSCRFLFGLSALERPRFSHSTSSRTVDQEVRRISVPTSMPLATKPHILANWSRTSLHVKSRRSREPNVAPDRGARFRAGPDPPPSVSRR